jgi:hypothetical protein
MDELHPLNEVEKKRERITFILSLVIAFIAGIGSVDAIIPVGLVCYILLRFFERPYS